MTPRILLLRERTWLPPFVKGRLLLGSAQAADVPMPGLLPFHALLEARDRGIVLHDLAHRGDVRDARGRPCPEAGAPVLPEERFTVAGHELAVFVDESVTEVSRSCAICGTGAALVSGQGRLLAGGLFVCIGCLGVVEQDPFTFPGHEIVARLGSGGMATVYLALIRDSDELRALKVFGGERGAHRFLREARLLLGLLHPNIVRVFDAGEAGGMLFLSCELVPGGDALARLTRHGPFSLPQAARLGAEVASALVHAHARGIVHRDVKPSNVLLSVDGTAKLADFGLAKELAASSHTTVTGTTLGTIAYASPEQLRDARQAGPSTDVFGLAATLFHLLTGSPPRRSADQPVVSPRALLPSLDQRLAQIIERGLSFRPEDRPGAPDMEASLRALAGR